jgi:hypothetical protein
MYTFRETIELFLQCNKPGDVGSRGGEMSAAGPGCVKSPSFNLRALHPNVGHCWAQWFAGDIDNRADSAG